MIVSNRFHAAALVLACVAFGACKGRDTVTVSGANGTSMDFRAPHDETMRRNETGEILLRIERKGFSEIVSIEVENLPNGIKVLNEPLKFEVDQERVILHLQASNDAELITDRHVTVRVRGPGGMVAAQSFDLTIKPSR